MLYEFPNVTAFDYIGISVASAGDANGDGRADFVVGVHNPLGRNYVGDVYVYSGAKGDILYHIISTGGENWFGYSVASAEDVNGDGKRIFSSGHPLLHWGDAAALARRMFFPGPRTVF